MAVRSADSAKIRERKNSNVDARVARKREANGGQIGRQHQDTERKNSNVDTHLLASAPDSAAPPGTD